MKTLWWTFLLTFLPMVAKPLGSASLAWITRRPIPEIQPVSRFWHPKLNDDIPSKLDHLEKQLGQKYKNAHIVVTSGYRSRRHNMRLGRRLGFTHSGGRVALNSAHIKGKAVDFYVRYSKQGKTRVLSHKIVGQYARSIFDKTLVYNDHVHIEVY